MRRRKREAIARMQAERAAILATMARYFEVRSNYRRAKNPRPGEAHGFKIIATY